MDKEPVETKKATAEEVLIGFYNAHLRDFLAAAVRLRACKISDPNEVVGSRQAAALGPNQPPVIIEVKAKEMTVQEQKTYNMNAKFLRAVEEELEVAKKNPTLWRDTTRK